MLQLVRQELLSTPTQFADLISWRYLWGHLVGVGSHLEPGYRPQIDRCCSFDCSLVAAAAAATAAVAVAVGIVHIEGTAVAVGHTAGIGCSPVVDHSRNFDSLAADIAVPAGSYSHQAGKNWHPV